jgi:hypothetical protein
MWFWTLEMSRVLMLAGSMSVGVIIGLLLGRPWKKRKMEMRQTPKAPTPKPPTSKIATPKDQS